MIRLLVLLSLVSCATIRRTGWAGCTARSIEGNLLVCDDHAYAQLECLGGDEGGCKAVRVRTPGAGAAQIHCAPGFALDKADARGIKFFLELSPDQNQVWFKGGDFFGRSWTVYSPGERAIADANGANVWSRRDFSAGDARPVCKAEP